MRRPVDCQGERWAGDVRARRNTQAGGGFPSLRVVKRILRKLKGLSRGRRLALLALALCLAFLILSAAFIVVDGLTDEVGAADIAIIPGNTVEASGAPSSRLKARLDKAAEMYERGLVGNLFVSGGTGVEGFDEATVMKRYLVERGIPQERIFTDSEGVTTYHTARNAAVLMRGKGWTRALVVTQYFHVSRTKLALKRFGVSPVFSAHAEFFEPRDLYSTAREVFGYYSYMLRPFNP